MITSDLFQTALITPVKDGANKLYVVSGYATVAMAFHHLQEIISLNNEVKVHLVVGMCVIDGISSSNHKAFQKLVSDFPNNFECSYLTHPPQVHSKAYSWFNNTTPVKGFLGSANYTQLAFGDKQKEMLNENDANEIKEYYDSLISDTIYCTHHQAEEFIQIYNDRYRIPIHREATQIEESEATSTILEGLPAVTTSFLANDGTLPDRSGLNWGQREEEHRGQIKHILDFPLQYITQIFFRQQELILQF